MRRTLSALALIANIRLGCALIRGGRASFLQIRLATTSHCSRKGADGEVDVQQPRRVTVIGGGFAGLACAYHATKAGCKLYVFMSTTQSLRYKLYMVS
jgi:NADPH-dependent 2,4-dienoyl-CoA reductase/sulfur reductase-like enzyme